MSINGQAYIFDGCTGSAALLAAQIRAGQVFPKTMQAWLERHPPAPEPPKRKPRREAPHKLPSMWTARSKASTEFTAMVLQHVSDRTGLSIKDILGRRRTPSFVMARRRVILLLRRRGYSYHEIGRVMQRDHSTIIHYLARKDVSA